MDIELLTPEKYESFYKKDSYCYLSAKFCELNSYKVDEVLYFLFKDKKNRFLTSFGLKDGKLLCPYSAPFGIVSSLKEKQKIEHFEECINTLINYSKQKNISEIEITLPPIFYDENIISKWVNVILRARGSIKKIDLNYQFNLNKIKENGYSKYLSHSGRKNLSIAENSDNEFCVCKTIQDKRKAYDVICENRKNKGYPLRMSYKQISETISILNNNCFLVKNKERIIASAIVFDVTPKIAQVIYWGDVKGVSNLKPINYLAKCLVEYYSDKNYMYLDVGPSTENSIPNYGLCDFKESIGCEVSSKITLCINDINKI